MAVKFGMTLAEIIQQFVRGFIKQTGRKPSGLDNIKIQQEALQRFKNMNKVVDMKGNSLNPREGIMGGEQAQNFIRKSDPALYEDRGGNIIPAQFKSETEEQIKKRLMNQNKKSLDSMKKKLDEPDDMATGGRAGYYGGGQAMVGEDLSEIGHGSDSLMARNMQLAPNSMATTSTGLNYLLGEDNDTARVPYEVGGRIGYATKGKVSLSDLESLKGLKKARGVSAEPSGMLGLAGLDRNPVNPSAARSQRNKILDKAIAKLTYAVDNLDQKTREKVISAFNDQLQIGYETTMSGLKMDAADKVGIVPIDKETIYKAIVNMDLPKETKLEIQALGDAAGSEELAFSLSNNKLGITYDNESQTIQGEYRFDSKDGKTSITPVITKNQDSQIQSRVEIDKAIEGGQIDLDVEKDTTDNSLTTDFSIVKNGNTLSAKNVSGTDNNYFQAEGTAEVPAYILKDGSMPSISAEYYKDKGDNLSNYEISSELPITSNLVADISNTIRSNNTSNTEFGLTYNKNVKNPFKKDQSNSSGIFSLDARMDDDNNRNLFAKLTLPLGGNTTDRIGTNNFEYDDSLLMSNSDKNAFRQKKLEEEYRNNLIYSGNELSGLIEGTKNNFNKSDLIGPVQELASGGIARQGFKMGKRAFLKAMGAGVAGIASLKTGLLGFGKKEVAKKAATELATSTGSGTPPAYFFKLVDKIKMLGDDVTEKAATADRQVVKKYKDYELTEDVSTGEIQIMKNSQSDEALERFGGENATEEIYMRYKPSEKILLDESNPGGGVRKTLPEYEANTSYISNNRGNTGGILDDVEGVTDDVIREVEAGSGNVPESFYTGINPIKKADGGRIGYKLGKKVIQEGIPALLDLVKNKFGKKSITTADKIPTPQKTLDRNMFKNFETKYPETSAADATLNIPVQQEGKFTKAEYLIQRLENTIKESPDDKYVKETFPNFIKELKDNPELAKNENVFKELGGDLPEGQQIVVYGDDSVDFFTQKSGPGNIDRLKKLMAKHNISREKALKIMKMEPNDQVMELKMLEVANRKLNSEGGRIGMLAGGGLLKALINNLAKERGMTGSELLKIMNWKNLPSNIKNLMKKEDFDEMKKNRTEGVERWKDLMISQQEMTKNIDAGMNTPAAGLFKELEKTSPGYGIVPRNVGDRDILQMEQMIKNMETKGKGRKLNATGGLTTMLGE